MEIAVNDKCQLCVSHTTITDIRCFLQKEWGLEPKEYYLLSNGKLISDFSDLEYSKVYVIPRICGGKGGFGSMLRAIGAQIEKTTNREACRDLSGRRLRDINEEQRLKNWINQQAEREKEAKERRQKKLERLCEIPKYEFKDEQYDKERSELPEIVEDAVLRGLASCSSKRKASDEKPVVKKKKAKLWVDDELEDDLSSSDDNEGSDSEGNKNSPSNRKNSSSENSCNSELKNDIEKVETHPKNDEGESNSKTIEILENNDTRSTTEYNNEREKEQTNEIEEKLNEDEHRDTEMKENVEKN